MMPSRAALRSAVCAGLLLPAIWTESSARAQADAAAAASDPPAQAAPTDAAPSLAPPSLDGHPDAPYPPEALEQRVEGNVGLELDVDAAGSGRRRARDVAGRSRVRRGRRRGGAPLHVPPARRGGVAIPSTVQFTYEFHLPPSAARPAAGAGSDPPPRPPRWAARRSVGADRRRPVDAGAGREADQRGVVVLGAGPRLLSCARSAACRTSCASRPGW